MRLLTDENISPQVAVMLRLEGYDVVSVHEVGLQGKADPDVFTYAQGQGRVVVTQDLDFSTLQHLTTLTTEGVILLRLNHPSVRALLALLRRFLQQYGQVDMRGRVASVGSKTRFYPPI